MADHSDITPSDDSHPITPPSPDPKRRPNASEVSYRPEVPVASTRSDSAGIRSYRIDSTRAAEVLRIRPTRDVGTSIAETVRGLADLGVAKADDSEHRNVEDMKSLWTT